MAAKRILNEPESNQDEAAEKRTRNGDFSSIIGETAMANSFPLLCSSLEHVLRKVVQEEVERALRDCSRSIIRSSSLRIQSLEQSNLQLVFSKSLALRIFTASKVLDVDGNPLHLRIVDKSTGYAVHEALSRKIRVEILVLDGDFSGARKENWSSEEFEASIVKERTGKRPLIHGDVNIIMRGGAATIGDIEFTDNSSWIRGRKFRIGARISPDSGDLGVRIREAVTQPFMVKDHRGETYKKHHPPMLGDEVWRLEKIGKDGKLHNKLSEEYINTVQDFLKLSTTDPQRLKKILGSGMSEKMWETTLKHARTCEMGTKMYVFRGDGFTLFLDPVCRPVRGVINGEIYSSGAPSNIPKAYVESLVRQAYMCWHSLEEIDAAANEANLMMHGNLGDGYVNLEHADLIRSQQSEYFEDKEIDMNNEISEVFGGSESTILSSTYAWCNY